MPDIQPFSGIRYSSKRIPDLSQVVCGPYDVISPSEREALAARSPYNAVLIELAEKGKAPAGAAQACEASGLHNAAPSAAYEAVARTLKSWLGEGVLAKDAEAGYTVLEERFALDGRKLSRLSLWGAVKLSPFGKGEVHPHEKTFPGPKEDRFKVLSATRMNLSPVFGLSPDPSGRIRKGLAEVASREPLSKAAYQGVELRVHRAKEAEFPAGFWEAVRKEAVVIADGHHRYETALKFRDDVGGGESERVLMAIVPFESEGLVVQPTHRVVSFKDEALMKDCLKRIEKDFELVPLQGPGAADWEEEIASRKGAGQLGLLKKEGGRALGYGLQPKNWKAFLEESRKALPGHQDGFHALDVAVVSRLLPPEGAVVTPDRDAARAAETLCSTDRSLVFLVRAVPPGEVFGLSVAGERFPEKTTYFYPKMPTGIVFRPL